MKVMHRFSWYVAPPILQGVVSFASLPIATLVLGPAEYGMYALVTSVTALVTGIAGLSAGYPLAVYFRNLDEAGQRILVTTLVALSLLVTSLFGTGIVGAWLLLGHEDGGLMGLTTEIVAVAVASMIVAAPWSIGVELSVMLGQARIYGLTLIVQSLVSTAALIGSLFVFQFGGLSLFVAGLAGSVVALVGAWVVTRRYLNVGADIRSGLRFLHGVPSLTAANFLEVVQTAVERSMMAAYLGVSQLGIYSHSQQYRNLMATGVKAIARAVWPTSLEETQATTDLSFKNTRLVWSGAYLVIVLFGLFFAVFGDSVIRLLTNDKFTDAYMLVALWAVYMLIQNSGKPQTAMLYAHGRGVAIARISAASTLFGIVVAIAAIPAIGVYGAASAALLQQAAWRIGTQVYVRRHWPVRAVDGWVIGGSAAIAAVLTLVVLTNPSHWERVGLLLICFAGVLATGHRFLISAMQILNHKKLPTAGV